MPAPGSGSPSAVRPVRVLAIAANAYHIVRFLGPCQGLITHWHGKRSIPCPGPSVCPPALHRSRAVWKGYAPVEQWDERASCWWCAVLEVTEALEELLAGRKLRGEVWALSHAQAGAKQTPVTGFFCEQWPVEQVRPEFPIEPILLRFYHVAALSLGVPNPIPRRTLLEPSFADPPIFLAEFPPPEDRPATREQMASFLAQAREALSGRSREMSSVPHATNGNGRGPQK